MSTFFVKNQQIKEDKIEIIGEDYRHLRNVLRYQLGDELEICDEKEIRYRTQIIDYQEKAAICAIQQRVEGTTELPFEVTLFQGLPKADKLEQIIQKNTEMGVCEVIPVEMERSIVKVEEKNKEKKLERWNKIALEASKQSGRQKITKVYEVMKFKNIIENISKYDIVLLLYENEKSLTLKQALQKYRKEKKMMQRVAIMVGPEGGFSKKEIDILSRFENIQIVTVGARILRTETAGVVALAMLNYEFEL